MTGERNGFSPQLPEIIYFKDAAALVPRTELGGLDRKWTEHVLKIYGQIERKDVEVFEDPGIAEAKRMGFLLNALDDATLVQEAGELSQESRSHSTQVAEQAYMGDYDLLYDAGEITQLKWYEDAIGTARTGRWVLLNRYFDRFIVNSLRWHLHDTLKFPRTDAEALRANTVQDIIQDVWERIVRSLPTMRAEHPGGFKGWVYRTARSRAIDIIRRRHNPEQGLEDSLSGEYGRPADSLDDRELALGVRKALLMLPSAAQSKVITLATYSDYTLGEIAQLLDMTEGGAKQYGYRGRRLLAERLGYELSIEI